MIIKQFLTYINWDENYENNINMKRVLTYFKMVLTGLGSQCIVTNVFEVLHVL